MMVFRIGDMGECIDEAHGAKEVFEHELALQLSAIG